MQSKMSSAKPAVEELHSTSYGRWMALIAALLGWMFDGAEMGVFSMVGRSAVQDMLGIQGTPTPELESKIGLYFGIIIATFLVGAAAGGVLFGWLGDRIGRVRAMSLSVLTYALFTGLCGLAQTPLQLGVLRFIASLGMGGEWALGVALVMEVWPNRSRALMAGLIGAAANIGYMLVGFVGLILNSLLGDCASLMTSMGLSEATVDMMVSNKGWRLMMMLGTLPALLTFVIRIFVPESGKWEEEKAKGNASHWSTIDLVGVALGSIGPGLIVAVWAMELPAYAAAIRIAGTLLGFCIAIVGYSYPVVRYLQRVHRHQGEIGETAWPTLRRMYLGAALSGVALLGTWGSSQWGPTWAGQLTQNQFNAREWTQIAVAFGATVGTIIAAIAGGLIGRKLTYFLLCLASMAAILRFFQYHTEYGTSFLVWAAVLGACTSSFYGWLPLYLPELFATRVRATGQGFAFNFGRILAAIGTLQIGAMLPYFSNTKTMVGVVGGYPVACSCAALVYVVGMILIAFAPETRGRDLPD